MPNKLRSLDLHASNISTGVLKSGRINPVNKPKLKKRHPITGCRADSLIGPWFMESDLLEGYRSMVAGQNLREMKEMSEEVPGAIRPKVVGNVGVVEISGPTTKYKTSFQAIVGGTSTLEVARQLTKLGHDPEIGAILIKTDSPGGSVHGAFDFADVVAKVAAKKPVIMFGHGYVTSAAMLSGSQTSYRIVTPETVVGSIGVKAVLRDTSKAMDAMGVKVIPVTTGKHKVTVEPGTPITPAQVKAVKEEIQPIHDMFVSYVAKGIGLSAEAIDNLEAAAFLAVKGKEHGLVDEIGDEDRAMAIAAEAATNPEKYMKKRGEPAPSGQADSTQTKPAALKGTRTMLNDQQLAEARQLPGAPADMTAENADVALLTVAKSLVSKASSPPQKMAADQAGRFVNLAHREVDLFVKEETLSSDQVTALKGAITADSVQSDGNILLSLDKVKEVFALNQPKALTKDVSKDQKVLDTNKEETDADKKSKLAAARAAYGLTGAAN